ncbi:MAG TPA: type I-F CRISPR-associated endoribonuclease Cas6/Csy4 [Accumulibacter sp.]|nr:type I-F CRISPR-associated endoribonuclease Cas6/Csy4 [Accumulibacter sp.]HNF91584.1 type I-F CRISPR-associated endoribonuclease Cas6/Csy4 [Accumulibacter sp.]
MDAYADLRLMPDPEFPATLLMNALFSKLHRGLCEWGTGEIGVSFPAAEHASPGLGPVLRIHAGEIVLQKFMNSGWLSGMRDHLQIVGPRPIPAQVHHRVVRRVQSHSSPERERRRLMARKGLSAEEALRRIPDSRIRLLDLPYVALASRSTGQQFKLFIEQGPLMTDPSPGRFSAYGLGTTATIPWF